VPVAVLLGNGTGNFRPPVTIPLAAGNVRTLATGDFNGDGKLDLIVVYAFRFTNLFSVLLGNGDGTFRAPVDYSVSGPRELGYVITVDVNGDGLPDIITFNTPPTYQDRPSVSIMLNNGNGTFAPSRDLSLPFAPGAIAAFPHPGSAPVVYDLAVNNSATGAISIPLNNGAGSFSTGATFPTGRYSSRIIAEDFNGDSLADLVTVNRVSNNVSVFLGNADATFTDNGRFAIGWTPDDIATGDFNSDGKKDFALPAYGPSGSQGISILLNNGDGTFAPPIAIRAATPRALISVDVDGDGKPDLAVIDTSNNVSVFTNNARP
jgi:hypothetical protein